MFNSALLRRKPPRSIAVEFDGKGGREKKTFTDIQKARRFWDKKYREGKNPRYTDSVPY